MSADVTSLADARAARDAAPAPGPAVITVAQRYVQLAEEAIALAPGVHDPEQHAAVCLISEAWLALAEAALLPANYTRTSTLPAGAGEGETFT